MPCSVEVREQIYNLLKDGLASMTQSDIKDQSREWIVEQLGASHAESGCSKLVLYFDAIPDWVVKIPFYFEEDELDIPRSLEEICKNPWDTCEREAYLYAEACYHGYADMLAGTYFVGTVGDIYIYCSERCYTWDKNRYDDDSENYKEANRLAGELCDNYSTQLFPESEEVIKDMIIDHTYQTVRELLDWLNSYKINDIHDQNCMIGSDQKMKIIDYGGYFGDW